MTMHTLSSRKPLLNVFIGVAINLILFGICHRYYTVTSQLHQIQEQQAWHQQQLQEQELFFNEQKTRLEEQQIKLNDHKLFLQDQNTLLEEQKAKLDKALTEKMTNSLLVSSTPGRLSSFEVPESVMETHDVAIPRDIPAWTDADTVFLHTASGFNMMEDLLKLQYNRLQTELDKSQLDFSRIARAERMYKSLWDHVYHNFYKTQDSENTKTVRERELALFELAKTHVEVDFYLKLEKSIYPFLHLHPRQTSFSLYESYTKSSRGIVVCAGNGQFEFIVSSIQAIRLLNPTVPIEVFYMGDGDLSTLRQNYIRDMTSNIEVKDVTKILDNKEMILGGWSIKAFSMLASSFQEVILIDSDAYFLRDPAQLFSDPGYVATGALFFYDRTLWNDWRVGPDFLRSIMPTMSSFPKTTRWFRGLSAHEQESGVVVINKRTRFQGLLAVCKMNMKWERDLHSYKVFYGDKETFWTGFEMVQEPYSFMKTFSGVIGERREGHEESDAICGAQLHLNHLNEPTWWNGGLMRNKNSGVRRPLKFEFWKAGGGLQKHRERNVRNEVLMNRQLFELGLESKEQLDAGQKAEAEDPVWIFEESCLTGGEVRELSQEDKKLTSAYGRIDVIGKQDEARIKAGEAVDPKVYVWKDM